MYMMLNHQFPQNYYDINSSAYYMGTYAQDILSNCGNDRYSGGQVMDSDNCNVFARKRTVWRPQFPLWGTKKRDLVE